MVSWYYDLMVLHLHGTRASTIVLQFHGTMVLWYYDTYSFMVSWYYTYMVPGLVLSYYNFMVPRYYGTTILQFHGLMVP
jgi:hypothetical protein